MPTRDRRGRADQEVATLKVYIGLGQVRLWALPDALVCNYGPCGGSVALDRRANCGAQDACRRSVPYPVFCRLAGSVKPQMVCRLLGDPSTSGWSVDFWVVHRLWVVRPLLDDPLVFGEAGDGEDDAYLLCRSPAEAAVDGGRCDICWRVASSPQPSERQPPDPLRAVVEDVVGAPDGGAHQPPRLDNARPRR